MRLWRVLALVCVALLVGVVLGYVRWGREARDLRESLARALEIRPTVTLDPGPWTARGIVRILLPDQGVVFVTHETIAGVLPGTTRALQAESGRLLGGLTPGDPVRFTLARRGQRIVLVAIERDGSPPR